MSFLSKAIASALAEYCVVVNDNVDCNLLLGRIVLEDLRFKPKQWSLRNNSGRTTRVSLTGFIRKISLTWKWDWFGGFSKACWIQDAALEFQGCRFKIRLDQEDSNIKGKTTQEEKILREDSESKESIGNTEDDINAYLMKQLEMIINTLTLSVVDLELIVNMPRTSVEEPPKPVSIVEDPESIEIVAQVPALPAVISNQDNGSKEALVSFVVGLDEFRTVSLDMLEENNRTENLVLSSLFINVVETFHETNGGSFTPPKRGQLVCKTYPLLDPFHYNFELTRFHGSRFDEIERGFTVMGHTQLSLRKIDVASEMITASQDGQEKRPQRTVISIRLDRPQLEGIGRLSSLILPLQEESCLNNNEAKKVDDEKEIPSPPTDACSVFDFSIDGVVIECLGDIIAFTEMEMSYLADGNTLNAKVDTVRFAELPKPGKRKGISVTLSKIDVAIGSTIEVTVGKVMSLCVPEIIELLTPAENLRGRLVGETLTIDVDSVDGLLPRSGDGLDDGEEKEDFFETFFPIVCNIRHVRLVKDDEDETEIFLSDVEVLMCPSNDQEDSIWTDLACTVGCLDSDLLRATNIKTCMRIPAVEENPIENFALSLDSVSLTAGYSIQDWTQTFQCGGKWRLRRRLKQPTVYPRMPYASVAPLNATIAYNAMSLVALKETAFIIKAYNGNESTTAKNLIDFYVVQCLRRTRNFLQNAELLGINVEDASAFSLGATLGLANHIGPFAGVAAVVGVDAIRGSIEAGKRSRNANKDDDVHFADFFRGIGYSAVEATRTGKLRRGAEEKKQGNVLDWMIGATVNTTDYIGNNKDTLGSASGAGAGVLVGTLLGGPVGAVIGGVIGGWTTGTAIRKVDRRLGIRTETKKIESESQWR